MRSKLPFLGVLIVLGAGYMAAQPFRQSSPQTTASAPNAPRTPLRWNEPVPLQVTSSGEFSPADVPAPAAESESRQSFDRIPRIQASGEFAALADPPPQIATSYEVPGGTDPFAGTPSPSRDAVATPVSTTRAEETVAMTSPVGWAEAPRQADTAPRVASLPPREPTHPSAGVPRVHRVVDGDSLPRLAERYLGSATRYLEIYEANREMLASPDLLPIGAKLVIPVDGAGSLPRPIGAVQQTTAHPPPAREGLVPIGGL